MIKPKDTLVINKQCRSEICPEIHVDLSHQLTAQLMHVAELTWAAGCAGNYSEETQTRQQRTVMSEWREREEKNTCPGVFVRQI